MKKALTAGLVLAGIIAMSGTSFAAQHKPPRDFDGKRLPMMSRDIRSERDRPPLPPDDRHPRVSRDRRPNDDRRPPRHLRSGDRRPPEFDRATKQQGVEPR